MTEICEQLSNQLKVLSDYFESNELALNVQKTEFIVFGRKHIDTSTLSLKLNDTKICPVRCVKFLGVYFDSHLTFKDETNNLLRKMACGIRKLQKRRHLPLLTKVSLLKPMC